MAVFCAINVSEQRRVCQSPGFRLPYSEMFDQEVRRAGSLTRTLSNELFVCIRLFFSCEFEEYWKYLSISFQDCLSIPNSLNIHSLIGCLLMVRMWSSMIRRRMSISQFYNILQPSVDSSKRNELGRSTEFEYNILKCFCQVEIWLNTLIHACDWELDSIIIISLRTQSKIINNQLRAFISFCTGWNVKYYISYVQPGNALLHMCCYYTRCIGESWRRQRNYSRRI